MFGRGNFFLALGSGSSKMGMNLQQVCILVGCESPPSVPPLDVSTAGDSVQGGLCPGALCLEQNPPPSHQLNDLHTLLQTFPCPKLCSRAVTLLSFFQWRIQEGTRDTRYPPRSNFFIFMQFVAKYLPSNKLAYLPLGLVSPIWDIQDLPLIFVNI